MGNLMRGGIGAAIKEMLKEHMGSREVSEKIHEAVGADKRLAQVRYGTFAQDGAVKAQYLPQGMSPNLLPAKWAEYESYTDTEQTWNTYGGAVESWVEAIGGIRFLITDGNPAPASYHNPYLESVPAGVPTYQPITDGLTYIYSTTAVIPPWGVSDARYVGLRIRVADDSAGTNSQILYSTPDTTADMWKLEGNNAQQRIYVKFTVPAGKKYISVSHKILDSASLYVGWNWNMLETVSDFRSFPSKYAAPTPRMGELSNDQLAFDNNPNMLPFEMASMAFDPATVTINSVTQGTSNSVDSKPGFTFTFATNTTTALGTYYGPWDNPHRHITTPSADTYIAGQQYIMSVYITNRTNTQLKVNMRVGFADNVTDLTNKSGTYSSVQGQQETLLIGERRRIWLKYTHPAAANGFGKLGPRLDFKMIKGNETQSTSAIDLDSAQLEEAAASTTEPSNFKPPLIGTEHIPFTAVILKNNQISLTQVEQNPVAALQRLTDFTVAQGAEVTLDFGGVDYSVNWSSTNINPPVVTIERAGVYLLVLRVSITLNDAQVNKVNFQTRLNSNSATDQGIVGLVVGANSGNPTLSGSQVRDLAAGDDVRVRMSNLSSVGSRTVNNARFYVCYIGDS